MLTESSPDGSMIEREKRGYSAFRPPKFVKAAPPARKALTATARPWYPGGQAELPAKPAPRPISAPLALGLSPELKPKSAPPPVLSELMASPDSTGRLFSPLTTPVLKFFHSFSEEATEERVYPIDMFMSVRKDASHTPHEILKWCVRQYLEVPSLKVPAHLQLSMSEVASSDDGITRGSIGCGLKSKTRSKPVRQTHHKVMSILSRITPHKYNELLMELLQLPLRQSDDAELHEIAKVFFDKAVQEHDYSGLYAQLASEICTMKDNELDLEHELRDRLLCNRMRKQLITTCQEQFRRPIELTADEMVDRTTGRPFHTDEVDMKRTRMKNRLVGNVKFVGELLKMSLVTVAVVEDILQLLVGDYNPTNPHTKEEYVFEVFSTLLKTVASLLTEQKPHVLSHFLGIASTVCNSHPRPRVRFLMMDLDDLNRKNGWIPVSRVTRDAETYEDSLGESASPTSDLSNSLSAPLQEGFSRNEPFFHKAVLPSSFSSTAGPAPNSSANTARPQNCKTLWSTISANPPPPQGTPTVPTPPSTHSLPAPKPMTVKGAPGICSSNAELPRSPTKSAVGATEIHLMRSEGLRTPVTRRQQPEVVNIKEVTQQLIEKFNFPEEEGAVIRCVDDMSLKNKVLCLTWWLRLVSMNTAQFAARKRVANLLSAILGSCTSLKQGDLFAAIIEWIRFDIENAMYDQCPRMFDNIAHMIFYCHSEEAAKLPHIKAVRQLLPVGLFNIMMHELTTERGTDQMVTLVKAAHSISLSIVGSLQDPPTDAAILRLAVENRFRLLPYFLSVSGCLESDMPGTPVSTARAPNTPTLRNIPLGDSITSTGHYDPLSQCFTVVQRITEDAEFALFRKVRDEAEKGDSWKDEAVRIALSPPGNGSVVSQVVQVMKVTGALLACTSVSQHSTNLILFTDLDVVVGEILRRRPSPLFQAAVALELIMHYTQALSAGDNAPRRSTRIKPLRQTFGRWCNHNLMQRDPVVDMLKSLELPGEGVPIYTIYHNAIADNNLQWATVLSCV